MNAVFAKIENHTVVCTFRWIGNDILSIIKTLTELSPMAGNKDILFSIGEK